MNGDKSRSFLTTEFYLAVFLLAVLAFLAVFAKGFYSSSDSRVFTTRLRWGVLYFFRMVVTSFLAA
jgi:hypothetical protein